MTTNKHFHGLDELWNICVWRNFDAVLFPRQTTTSQHSPSFRDFELPAVDTPRSHTMSLPTQKIPPNLRSIAVLDVQPRFVLISSRQLAAVLLSLTLLSSAFSRDALLVTPPPKALLSLTSSSRKLLTYLCVVPIPLFLENRLPPFHQEPIHPHLLPSLSRPDFPQILFAAACLVSK